MLLKGIAQLLSPAGRHGQLSILIFHRVLSEPDLLFPGEPDIRRFDEIVGWVRQWFQIVPLDQAVDMLKSGTLVARAAAITFDDGYADNATNALPVLVRHGVTATFFVSTSFLDGGCMWNDSVVDAVRSSTRAELNLTSVNLGVVRLETMDDRRQAVAALLGTIKYLEPTQRRQAVDRVMEEAGAVRTPDLMMRPHQVRELHAAGMTIGAHTCTHPILKMVDDASAVREIVESKARLESELQTRLTLFAYPNGKPDVDYAARHVEMVRHAGFDAAVSTAPGVAGEGSDLFQLPRFTPWDRTHARFGLRMLANLRGRHPALAAVH